MFDLYKNLKFYFSIPLKNLSSFSSLQYFYRHFSSLSSFGRCGSNLSGASLLGSMYTKRNAIWAGRQMSANSSILVITVNIWLAQFYLPL